jgi:hypothetical protein
LVKTQENPPRWEPLSDVYGLVIGENDEYSIPNFSVSLDNKSDTEYDLYSLHMRFAPQNKGTLFRGQFDTANTDLSSLSFEVLLGNEDIVLSVQNGSIVYKESISADLFSDKKFIVTVLQFYSFKNELFARLEFQDLKLSTEIISFQYEGTLSGAGEFRFGAVKNSVTEMPIAAGVLPDTQSADVAIIDEFFLGRKRVFADF